MSRYADVFGPIPDADDPSTWAAAWVRECDRAAWVRHSLAHSIFRGLEPQTPESVFAKQMALLPDAVIPDEDDRSECIAVVRTPAEMGYCRRYGERRSTIIAAAGALPKPGHLIMRPPYVNKLIARELSAPLLSACRHHRNSGNPHLVGWHNGEFPSVPQPVRPRYYVRVPSWWTTVEVPFGDPVDPPLVFTYASDDLKNHVMAAWVVFRAEWTVSAGASLVEAYRKRGIMWLYPPRLQAWIASLGTSTNYLARCRRGKHRSHGDPRSAPQVVHLHQPYAFPHGTTGGPRQRPSGPSWLHPRGHRRRGWGDGVQGERGSLPRGVALRDRRPGRPTLRGIAAAWCLVDGGRSSSHLSASPLTSREGSRPGEGSRDQAVHLFAVDPLQHRYVPTLCVDQLSQLPPPQVVTNLARFAGRGSDDFRGFP